MGLFWRWVSRSFRHVSFLVGGPAAELLQDQDKRRHERAFLVFFSVLYDGCRVKVVQFVRLLG